jgi:hypothetical protein
MQIAVRPHVKTGVAILGASALAITPIAVAPPERPVPLTVSSATQLASAINPLTALTDLFNNTVDSTGGLINQFLDSPFPILAQIARNQVANVEYVGDIATEIVNLLPDLAESLREAAQTFAQQIAAGDFIGAADTLNQAIIFAGLPLIGFIAPPVAIINHSVQNLAAASNAIADNVIGVLLGALGPINSFNNAVFDIAQTVYDSLGAGELVNAVGALLSAPIVVVDAVLNGYSNNPWPGVGLLSAGGPLSALLDLRNAIANAMTPLPPLNGEAEIAGANQAPDAGAPLVTLDVDEDTVALRSASYTEGDIADAAEGDAGDAGEGSDDAVGADDGDDEGEEDGDLGDLGDDGEEGNDGSTANGGTDLSGGNKAEPGQTGGSDANTGGDGDDDTTSTTPSDDAGNGGEAGEGSGGGAGGDGSSDGGSDE